MTKYPRGSEWRKWDLHIHTPGTAKNDHFPTDINWGEYLDALESHTDIAVLGVTDYFSIENYLKLKNFQDQGRLQGKFLIPNIELRILPVTASETPINLHVLFDPELEIACIQREFLKKLTLRYRGSTFTAETNDLIALGRQYKDSPALEEPSAWREGINQFNVPYGQISEALKSPCLAGHFVVAVSNKSTDGNSGIQESALRANRQEIYRLAHIIFSSSPSDVDYFLGKGTDSPDKVIADYGSLKPCVIGSDAHDLASVNVFPGNRITWIKSDPSFNGLKQIIYEPEERVRIQEGQPETKSIYYLIDTVTLSENGFWNQSIPINENLSVIIGGRSTGKSTLLASIAEKISPNSVKKTHDQEASSGRDAFISDHINGISVSWKDHTDNADRMVDYFPQSYMYEIAKDQHEVDALIESLIKEDHANASLLANLEAEITTNQDAIIGQCATLASLYKDFLGYCEAVRTSGNVSGIRQEIDQLQENANSLKNGSGMSDDEYVEFEKKQDELSKKKAKCETLEKDKAAIENLKSKSIINAAFRYEFNNLSEERRAVFEQSYESFIARITNDWGEYIRKELAKIEQEIVSCAREIQDIENTPVYKKGVQYILANKQYSDYQEKIAKEKEKLQQALSLIQKRDTLIKQIDAIKEDIIKRHLEFREKTLAIAEKVQLNIDDLSLSASSQLLSAGLRTFLEPKLRKKSDEEKLLISELSDGHETDLARKLLRFINGLLDGSVACIAGNEPKDVLCDFLSKNWYSITYDLVYQGDSFKSMSPGKQAFVILKLLLEFSKRKCPILIDQPEDSLDNRAIYTELVAYLRKKKKERQIILVSHNPNVVVGADAEQVIVANQHGADSCNEGEVKFQYYSGALENSQRNNPSIPTILASQGIREHVCDILEGGLEAFSRREKKYGIQR